MKTILILLLALLATGCDKTIMGVTFDSGFGVSDAQAHNDGVTAGIRTCATQQRQFAKYRSGTDAALQWSAGWANGMVAAGCGGQI